MKINRVVVYSTAGLDDFADVKAWAEDGEKDTDTMTTEISITSKGGQKFSYFAKSGDWNKPSYGMDLYRDLVAPKMGNLDMEGWRRGAGVWDAACGKVQVLDITEVSFPDKDWITGDDHSKWAVGETASVFCVGDINRADGQDKRGGGTVCISSSTFSKQMKGVIKTTDKCSKLQALLTNNTNIMV